MINGAIGKHFDFYNYSIMIYYIKMNKERYTQIVISFVLAALLFGLGFYFGQQKVNYNVPAGILNATSSLAGVDWGPFWKTWQILDEKFAPASSSTPKILTEEKLWSSIEGLASSYNDPYTVFFPPVESKAFEEEIKGSFGGIGMEIGLQDETLTVIAPLKGTPAEAAGILPGDKIIMIGEKSALKMSTDEAIKLIRGEPGTSVTITFVRKGVKDPIVKTLIRANIEIPTINTRLLPENVFVINLYSFSAISPNLFRGALREFVESGSDKLILDLRNNPGGYLEAALDMASWFLPTGKTVVTEDFGEKREPKVYRSKGYDVFNENLKFVILVNEGSASASEILAGALREYNKAILIGQKTFGKGSVQELTPITDKTSLKVTVAHWLTPLGNSISNGGLKPDIEVKIAPEDIKGGKDPQLKAAIEYLTK
jgi:carboxyl-terminal processing protease